MKTQTPLKSIFGMAFIALLLLMVSCDAANNPSALVGHWLHESGGTDKKPEDMELFKDGTGICDGGSISWKVENKRFIIQSSSLGMASDYEISGARLTLTNNGEDKFGFSALPGGIGGCDGYFGYIGIEGSWWSASDDNGIRDSTHAWHRFMRSDMEYAGYTNDFKLNVRSVCCLQD